jgi:hypothetical protein
MKEETQSIVDERDFEEIVNWIESNSNVVRRHRKNEKR